ncbi:unnamed protein product [Amoebophrya sp. A120]|nr:unnamed protein product [Amoebophrya sp. A120]|eukprot:GSA120T00024466001.1
MNSYGTTTSNMPAPTQHASPQELTGELQQPSGRGLGSGSSSSRELIKTAISEPSNNNVFQWFLLFPFIVWTWDWYEGIVEDILFPDHLRLQLLTFGFVGFCSLLLAWYLQQHAVLGFAGQQQEFQHHTAPSGGAQLLQQHQQQHKLEQEQLNRTLMSTDAPSQNQQIPMEVEAVEPQIGGRTATGDTSLSHQSHQRPIWKTAVQAFSSILVATSAWVFIEKLVVLIVKFGFKHGDEFLKHNETVLYSFLLVGNFLVILLYERMTGRMLLAKVADIV